MSGFGTPAQPASPYEVAMRGIPESLHPRLRAYFSAIPAGHHGYGRGSFSTVGTPRWWLWPLLRMVGHPDILFPVWQHDVAFTVINRPVSGEWPAVLATRTFELAAGNRVMTDAITATPDGLADYLGAARRMKASLAASVRNGALHLDSTAVSLRLGRRWVRVPGWIAPTVALTERFDDVAGLQRIDLAVTMPGIGTVYEYVGSFSYEIRTSESRSGRTTDDTSKQ